MNGGEEKIAILDAVDWNVRTLQTLQKISPYLIQAWLYGEGLSLPVEMEYDSTLAKQAFEVRVQSLLSDHLLKHPPKLASRWEASRSKPSGDLDFKPSDIQGWNTNQLSNATH